MKTTILNKNIVISLRGASRPLVILNHEFSKWFEYLVKTYGIGINSINFLRGRNIKRSLLNNKLLTILRSIGIRNAEQVVYIASGFVAVIINSRNLRVYIRDYKTTYYIQQPRITVNLIKFYKYQKNDNTRRG